MHIYSLVNINRKGKETCPIQVGQAGNYFILSVFFLDAEVSNPVYPVKQDTGNPTPGRCVKYKSGRSDLGETSRKVLILFGPSEPFNLSIIYCTASNLDTFAYQLFNQAGLSVASERFSWTMLKNYYLRRQKLAELDQCMAKQIKFEKLHILMR